MQNDNLQPNQATAPTVGNPSIQSPSMARGQKVIQPSPGLAQELEAQRQQEAANQPPAQPVQQAAQPTAPPASSSIYPEATHGASAGTYKPPTLNAKQTDVAPENNKTKLIIIAVKVFGAFMIVVAALSLISWIRVSSLKGVESGSSVLGIILAGGELLLGTGILLRRETARAVYVVLALILLVFSLYGTYSYFNAVRKLNQSEQTNITRTQQEITQYQNNANLTPSEKAPIIKTLQDNEQRQKQQLSKNKSTLLPLLEGYAISILPLVFLTRPAVKEVFE